MCAGNILLTSCQTNPHGFCAKISDFGLARNLDLVSRVETKTTGTVTHMPPEVLSDGIISKASCPPTAKTFIRVVMHCAEHGRRYMHLLYFTQM